MRNFYKIQTVMKVFLCCMQFYCITIHLVRNDGIRHSSLPKDLIITADTVLQFNAVGEFICFTGRMVCDWTGQIVEAVGGCRQLA